MCSLHFVVGVSSSFFISFFRVLWTMTEINLDDDDDDDDDDNDDNYDSQAYWKLNLSHDNT